jgi:hypothetical protein
MNNTIIRKVEVTADWQTLSSVPLTGSGNVSCPPGNSADVIFQGDDGSEVPWIPGEWHPFRRVRFDEIKVKGTPGDIVTINGGSW